LFYLQHLPYAEIHSHTPGNAANHLRPLQLEDGLLF
jgi:hypothetical protein